MKSFASIWLEGYEMPSWRLFYSGVKGGVELSFVGLLELFPLVTPAIRSVFSVVGFGGSFPCI
jgi:hypothetical protein